METIPQWVCDEIDRVKKYQKKQQECMDRVQEWIEMKGLLYSDDDRTVRSFVNKDSRMELADIELGHWTGEMFQSFMETGKI